MGLCVYRMEGALEEELFKSIFHGMSMAHPLP